MTMPLRDEGQVPTLAHAHTLEHRGDSQWGPWEVGAPEVEIPTAAVAVGTGSGKEVVNERVVVRGRRGAGAVTLGPPAAGTARTAKMARRAARTPAKTTRRAVQAEGTARAAAGTALEAAPAQAAARTMPDEEVLPVVAARGDDRFSDRVVGEQALPDD